MNNREVYVGIEFINNYIIIDTLKELNLTEEQLQFINNHIIIYIKIGATAVAGLASFINIYYYYLNMEKQYIELLKITVYKYILLLFKRFKNILLNIFSCKFINNRIHI